MTPGLLILGSDVLLLSPAPETVAAICSINTGSQICSGLHSRKDETTLGPKLQPYPSSHDQDEQCSYPGRVSIHYTITQRNPACSVGEPFRVHHVSAVCRVELRISSGDPRGRKTERPPLKNSHPHEEAIRAFLP